MRLIIQSANPYSNLYAKQINLNSRYRKTSSCQNNIVIISGVGIYINMECSCNVVKDSSSQVSPRFPFLTFHLALCSCEERKHPHNVFETELFTESIPCGWILSYLGLNIHLTEPSLIPAMETSSRRKR